MSEEKPQDASEGSIGQSASTAGLERPGYGALWLWFSLTYASWLTLPRVLMHEMPDEWQARMAELLREWDETWDSDGMPQAYVSAREDNKFTRWPEWLLNYRRPSRNDINRLRSNVQGNRLAAGYAKEPASVESVEAGLTFCCGKEEKLTLEIAALRNVVQSAMLAGCVEVFSAWNYHFPDNQIEPYKRPNA